MSFWGDWLRDWFAIEIEDVNEDPQREVEGKCEGDADEDCAAQEVP